MISKELLSEILKEYKFPFSYEYNTYNDYTKKIYFYVNSELKIDFFSISIHELVHRCKEWALSKGYYFEIHIKLSETHIKLWHDASITKLFKSFKRSTEPEAVFAACQWIIDTRS